MPQESIASVPVPRGSTCDDPTPVYRHYTSFAQAATENGLSRIYVGIHFRRAVTEGIEHGRKDRPVGVHALSKATGVEWTQTELLPRSFGLSVRRCGSFNR